MVKRSQIEHIIRSATNIGDVYEIIIIDSQSIFGKFPNPPDPLDSPRLRPALPAPIISLMKKSTISRYKRPAAKAAAKPVSKPLVAVRKAAQKPVHATRSAIRRAVRSVAEERHQAK